MWHIYVVALPTMEHGQQEHFWPWAHLGPEQVRAQTHLGPSPFGISTHFGPACLGSVPTCAQDPFGPRDRLDPETVWAVHVWAWRIGAMPMWAGPWALGQCALTLKEEGP